MKRYMELYSHVCIFCARSHLEEVIPLNHGRRSGSVSVATPPGAEFVAECCIPVCLSFVCHLKISTAINVIFSYLNRHWIKRELDEGKTCIYEMNVIDDRMFYLCECVDGPLEVLRSIMENHVERKGRNAIPNVTTDANSDSKTTVYAVLAVH
uniref:Uncharacterized protein n=1 Tax=Panagrolaimus sp. PS1159 TaxID=55785 RepID=A0AC35FFS2_9BILA